MYDVVMYGFFIIYTCCFCFGTALAKSKRGRYIDKPIYEFAPDITAKIGVGLLGCVLFSSIWRKNEDTIDNTLLVGLLVLVVILLIYQTIVFFANFIFNKISKWTDKSEKESKENKDNDKFVTDNIKDIFFIIDTSVCNGTLLAEVFFSTFIFVSLFLKNMSIEAANDLFQYLESFGMGNISVLFLTNSVILLLFSLMKLYRYITSYTKSKLGHTNELNRILDFLKEDVNS